jgi:Zn-dependent M28 family amino/carboxypeptidase
VKLLPGHELPGQGDDDWTNDSDHYSFHREGIPFLFFSVEDYEYYHTPNDDYENMMPDFYVGSVETILDVVRVLDQSFEPGKR